MTLKQKDRVRGAVLLILIGVITLLHYATQHNASFHHIVYREFYFLPILLAGFWYGMRGGLAVSSLVTVLYGAFILMSFRETATLRFGDFMELLLFNIIGGLLGWLRDREIKSQAALRKAESLAAMGRAVSAIAHDMKTPLIAIGGFAGQLRKKLADETLLKKVDIILSQSSRLEAMVKDMLAFARPLSLEKKVGDLEDLVRETVETATEIAVGKGVHIALRTAGPLPGISFDRHRLQQALLNLMVNAVEASPDGETVMVEVRPGDGAVEIDIADRGAGVSIDQRQEIFRPFVTTKQEGTGLGLATVKKIAEAHGGDIEVLDNGERGALFRFRLPAGEPS